MKKMSRMKRFMAGASAVSVVMMFLSFIVMKKTYRSFFMSMGLTFMTIAAHFISRLVLGSLVGGIPLSKIKPNERRYREFGFERGLYKKLRVKKWKKRFRIYDKALYSMRDNTPEELLRIVCRSELVHLYSAAVSLLTILLTIPFRALPLFLIMGIGGALIDLAFVIVMRYNRPRLERLTVNRAIIAAKAEREAEKAASESGGTADNEQQ